MHLALPLLTALALGAPISQPTPQGISTWADASSSDGWAAVAVAIDRRGISDLDALEALLSGMAGFGADQVAARGGQTRALLLGDALVIVDSVPAAELSRTLGFANARLMRPLEPTRLPVERTPLPQAARGPPTGLSLEELRARLMVREGVVVAVVAPGDPARLSALVRRSIRARLPKAAAPVPEAAAFAAASPTGPVLVAARSRAAQDRAALRVLAELRGAELRVGSDRVVLAGGREALRPVETARARVAGAIAATTAHPEDRAVALARAALSVEGGLPAVEAALAGVDDAALARASAAFGLPPPSPPAPPAPAPVGGEGGPVIFARPRPGAGWAARVIAVPGQGALAVVAGGLKGGWAEGGAVTRHLELGGVLDVRARPEGLIVSLEAPSGRAALLEAASVEVLSRLKAAPGGAPGPATRPPFTADHWRAVFGRAPRGAGAAKLDTARAAIFVDGLEAVTVAPPAPRGLARWEVAAAEALRRDGGPRSPTLFAAQALPFEPRVLSEGDALAAVVEARMRRALPRAEARFERTWGAALLGIRLPLEAEPEAALQQIADALEASRDATRLELRAAVSAVSTARAARDARVGDAARAAAARYLVTGDAAEAEVDERNLARLLWVLPSAKALRAIAVGVNDAAAAAPGGSG